MTTQFAGHSKKKKKKNKIKIIIIIERRQTNSRLLAGLKVNKVSCKNKYLGQKKKKTKISWRRPVPFGEMRYTSNQLIWWAKIVQIKKNKRI